MAPAPAVCRPPRRLASRTNLSREEAVWRSGVLALARLTVRVDVTGAGEAASTGFAVRSELDLDVRDSAEGLWVDFLGEAVTGVEVDDEEIEPQWDGARVALPALGAGQHRVVVEARGRYSSSGQGLHRFHDPVDASTNL